MKALFIGLLFSLSLVGCASQDAAEPGGVVISYAETQCADPWLRSLASAATGYVNDNIRAQSIISYLTSNGVPSARNVVFREAPSNQQFSCQACNCPSGRTVQVTISESDWTQASKLGFKR